MEINNARIELTDGKEIEYPSMPILEFIGKLFEIYGDSIEIILPDHVRDRIREQVKKDWYKCKLNISQDAYCKLAEEKEIDKYFAVQRALKTVNDYVISTSPYDPRLSELFPGTNDALNDLTIRKDENTSRGTTG